MKKFLLRFWQAWLDIMSLSFREAVLVPLSSYYRLRFDNAWWNEHHQKAFWYRLIALTTVMMIVISSLAISKSQYPWKLMEEKYEWAKQGLPMITKDFPMRIVLYARMWRAMTFNELKKDDIDKTLDDRGVKAVIFGLLKTRSSLSEIGGAAFLKDGLLNFYLVDSPNRLIALEINGALNDDSRLVAIYQKYKDVIQKKFGQDLAINKMASAIRQRPDDKDLIKRTLMHFVFLSGLDYEMNPEALPELFYDDSKGSYAGQFHVHKMGEPPSLMDLESSKIGNVFVLSEISGYKITFYWLKEGKIFLEKDIQK